MTRLVTVFQVQADKTRGFGFMGLEELRSLTKQPEAISMKPYEVVFGELQTEGNMTFWTGRDSENHGLLLEKLYELTNSPGEHRSLLSLQENLGYTGRSISVSDIVRINEDYYYCDSFGWTKIEVKHVPHWIHIGMGASGTYYTDLTPYEVIKVTPSEKTVTIRRMDSKQAEGYDYFSNQVYTYISDPKGNTETVRRNKYGAWKTPGGMRVGFGSMRKYQDPHF